MNSSRIAGSRFVEDGQDGNPAYEINAVRLAELYGYRSASETAVRMMGVRDGRFRSKYNIGEGVYNSAIFVEWYARGLNPAEPPSVFEITPSLLVTLASFFGKRTTAEAQDPAREDHEFLRSVLLAPLGAEVWIEWDRQKI